MQVVLLVVALWVVVLWVVDLLVGPFQVDPFQVDPFQVDPFQVDSFQVVVLWVVGHLVDPFRVVLLAVDHMDLLAVVDLLVQILVEEGRETRVVRKVTVADHILVVGMEVQSLVVEVQILVDHILVVEVRHETQAVVQRSLAEVRILVVVHSLVDHILVEAHKKDVLNNLVMGSVKIFNTQIKLDLRTCCSNTTQRFCLYLHPLRTS